MIFLLHVYSFIILFLSLYNINIRLSNGNNKFDKIKNYAILLKIIIIINISGF
jgi:hypothetical protein